MPLFLVPQHQAALPSGSSVLSLPATHMAEFTVSLAGCWLLDSFSPHKGGSSLEPLIRLRTQGQDSCSQPAWTPPAFQLRQAKQRQLAPDFTIIISRIGKTIGNS